MRQTIPKYEIKNIDGGANPHVLVEKLSDYLPKHYATLHRPHRHTFFHFVLFHSGTGSHTLDFESYQVAEYQMYFMAPGQVHSWHFESDVEGYIVHFSQELFNSFLHQQDYVQQFRFFSGSSLDGVLSISPAHREEVDYLFSRLMSEVNSKSPSLDMIRLLILELFLIVERCCALYDRDDVSHPSNVLVKQFRQLVDKHFRKLKLPKEYAKLLYITPNHLNSVTQDVLGMSAGDVIRDRIILEAKRLLSNVKMNVSEIAAELNFNDNSYFSRYFRKYVGLTPEQFRKSIKQ